MTSPIDAHTPPDEPGLDARRRRLLFRANHRGTHENDIMIGGYVGPRIADFTEAELDALEELLELPDVALADWLSGRRPMPADVETPMLRAIQAAVAAGGRGGAALTGRGGFAGLQRVVVGVRCGDTQHLYGFITYAA